MIAVERGDDAKKRVDRVENALVDPSSGKERLCRRAIWRSTSMSDPHRAPIRDQPRSREPDHVRADALPRGDRRGKGHGEAEEGPLLRRSGAARHAAKLALRPCNCWCRWKKFDSGASFPSRARDRRMRSLSSIEDVGDFRPECLLLDAVLERVDAGDDEAVELLVADVAESAIELVDVIGGRVL